MANFETIIFDLGGVIVDIDFQRADESFARLPAHSSVRRRLGELFAFHAQDQFFTQFEIGEISVELFRAGLKERLNLRVTDAELDQAWSEILVDLPDTRLKLLRELGQQHRLFLFSNTNELHQLTFEEMFRDRLAGGHISDLFEQVFYSHKLGDRKPNVSAYKKILEQANINPATAIFIDDSLPNIKGAEAAGLNAYHLTGGETILARGWESNQY